MEGKKLNYISLSEAAQYCPYSRDYLKLRARQKKLRAVKLGRDWATTQEWVEEYLKKVEGYKNNLKTKKFVSPLPYQQAGIDLSAVPSAGWRMAERRAEAEAIAKAGEPPENLPVEKITGVRPLWVQPAPGVRFGFAVALVFVLLTTGVVFGRDSFKNVFQDLNPIVSPVRDFIVDNSKEIAADISNLVRGFSEDFDTGLASQIGNSKLGIALTKFANSHILNKIGYQTADIGKTVGDVFKEYGQWLVAKGAKLLKKGTEGLTSGVKQGYQFITKLWQVPPEKVPEEAVIEKEVIEKEVVKEVEVSKVTRIEPLKEIIKEVIKIDDKELAKIKTQISQFTSWGADIENLREITKKLQAQPANVSAPTAPIYIGSQGLQVGGAGIFSSLGVSGSAGIGNLGVGGSTSLGSTATDRLSVNATAQFLNPVTVSNTFNVGGTTNYLTVDLAGNLNTTGSLTIGGTQTGAGIVSFTASSTSPVLTVSQNGTGQAAKIDNIQIKDSTISTFATDTAILINPNGTGAVQFHATTNYIDSSGNLVLDGDITLTAGGAFYTTDNSDLIFAPNGSGNLVIGESGNAAKIIPATTTPAGFDLGTAVQRWYDAYLYNNLDIASTTLSSTTLVFIGAGEIKTATDTDLVLRISGTGNKIVLTNGTSTFQLATSTKLVLGDSDGVNQFQIYDSSDNKVAYVDSDGKVIVAAGKFEIASTGEISATSTKTLATGEKAFYFKGPAVASAEGSYLVYIENLAASTTPVLIKGSGSGNILQLTDAGKLTINGDFLPFEASAGQIGYANHRWWKGYFVELTADNIIATAAEISGTKNNVFTVNTDATTTPPYNTESVYLQFKRPEGTYATMFWDNSNNRFDFDVPFYFSTTTAYIQGVGQVNLTAAATSTWKTIAGDLTIETEGGNLALISAGSLTETFATGSNYSLIQGTTARLAIDTSGNISATGTTITLVGATTITGNTTTTGDVVINGNLSFVGDRTISGTGTLKINPTGNLFLQIDTAYIDDSGNIILPAGTRVEVPELRFAGDITINASSTGATKVTVKNENGSQVANLEIEGDIEVQGGKITLASGETIEATTTDKVLITSDGTIVSKIGSTEILAIDSTGAKITGKATTTDTLYITSGGAEITGNVTVTGQLSSAATTTLAAAEGFVGIATTTPYSTEKLSVYGNIYGSGNIVLADTSATSTFYGNLLVSQATTLGSATSTPVIFTGYVKSDIIPYSDIAYNLGSSSYRWANIYAATTTIGGTIVIGTNTFEGSATTTLFTTSNANQLVLGANGKVGIGMTGPYRKLDVLDVSYPQLRITQADNDKYTEFQVNAAGDLTITTSGNDLTIPNDNLWVCGGGSCPDFMGIGAGTGNLVVEKNLYVGDSTTDYVKFYANSSAGAIEYYGKARPKRSIILTASGGITPSSGGAAQTKVDGSATEAHTYYVLDFNDSSDQAAFWQWTMPDSYDDSNIDVTFYWAANATSGSVVWCFKSKGLTANNAEDIDPDLSGISASCVNDEAQANANDIASIEDSDNISNFTKGEYVIFKVFRDADNGSDNMIGDARLLKVKMEYSVSQETD